MVSVISLAIVLRGEVPQPHLSHAVFTFVEWRVARGWLSHHRSTHVPEVEPGEEEVPGPVAVGARFLSADPTALLIAWARIVWSAPSDPVPAEVVATVEAVVAVGEALEVTGVVAEDEGGGPEDEEVAMLLYSAERNTSCQAELLLQTVRAALCLVSSTAHALLT